MSAATLPINSLDPAMRRRTIGASDAAAALNVSPWKTPLMLYEEKLGLAPAQEENAAMRRGKRRETIILDDYADEQGIDRASLVEQPFHVHPEYPFISATLDASRIIDGIVIPVEIKHVGRRSAKDWGDEGDQIPVHYLCQVHQQIAVMNAPYAHVAAELAGDYAFFTIERDEDFLADLIAIEAEFWQRVIDRRPPPATSVADIKVLARLNPNPEGEGEISEELAEIAARYKKLGKTISEAEKQRDELKVAILNALGNTKVGRSKSGIKIAKSVFPVKESVHAARIDTRITVTLPKE